jgi:regulator of protease activity HflC (stomatin/prohibitin superfamily)
VRNISFKWLTRGGVRSAGPVFLLIAMLVIVIGAIAETSPLTIGLFLAGLAILFLIGSAIQVCPPTDKFVIVRWGGELLPNARGPGIVFVYWFLGEKAHSRNIQPVVVDPPITSLITKDRIPVQVDPIATYEVIDAPIAWKNRDQLESVIYNAILDSTRDTIAANDLEVFLTDWRTLRARILKLLEDLLTEKYGVSVIDVGFTANKYPPQIDEMMTQRAAAEKEAEAAKIFSTAQRAMVNDSAETAKILREYPEVGELLKLRAAERIAAAANAVVMVPTSALDSIGGSNLALYSQLLPKRDAPHTDSNPRKELPFTE